MIKKNILNFKISFPKSYKEAINEIMISDKGYVIFANSNTLAEADKDIILKDALKKADIIFPDGFPLVLIAKLKGLKVAKRISGPDFTYLALNHLNKIKAQCCFYGGTEEESQIRKKLLRMKFPKMILDSFSEEKEKEMIDLIKENKIKYLFISLGSPKQEIWAYKNHKNLNCKIFCVGIAVPYILGEKNRAPKIMQRFYLEWFYRLITEPKKSWKRYLINGPKFIFLSLKETIFK